MDGLRELQWHEERQGKDCSSSDVLSDAKEGGNVAPEDSAGKGWRKLTSQSEVPGKSWNQKKAATVDEAE